MKKLWVGIGLLLILLGIVSVICLVTPSNSEVLITTAKSADGRVASVVAYPDSIVFGSYAADLVFYGVDGKSFRRLSLVESRDAIEDIQLEFLRLEFDGNLVHLVTKEAHYHGTNKFFFGP
jgi:hypothetical protein